MKKLILLLLLTSSMLGQNAYVNTTINSVNPNPVCAGDSITVCFSLEIIGQIDPEQHYPVFFSLSNNSFTTITTVIPNWLDVYDLHYPFCNGVDVNDGFMIKLPIPHFAPSGTWLLYSSGTSVQIEVNGCYVGLTEYENSNYKPVLIDIYGNVIYYDPNTRRKYIITK